MRNYDNVPLTPFEKIDFDSKMRATYYCLMNPKQAESLLPRKANRDTPKSRILGYARQMKLGDWGVQSAPMQFDLNGTQFNGSTTLSAIITSGTEQIVKIEVGCRPEEREYCDDHRPREFHVRMGCSKPLGRVINLATLCLRTGAKSSKATPIDGRALRDQIEYDYFNEVEARAEAARNPYNSDTIKLAVVVRLMLHPEHRSLILDSYSQLVDISGDHKSAAIANLILWITDPRNKATAGGQRRFRLLAAALTAFDPKTLSSKKEKHHSMSTTKAFELVRSVLVVPQATVKIGELVEKSRTTKEKWSSSTPLPV